MPSLYPNIFKDDNLYEDDQLIEKEDSKISDSKSSVLYPSVFKDDALYQDEKQIIKKEPVNYNTEIPQISTAEKESFLENLFRKLTPINKDEAVVNIQRMETGETPKGSSGEIVTDFEKAFIRGLDYTGKSFGGLMEMFNIPGGKKVKELYEQRAMRPEIQSRSFGKGGIIEQPERLVDARWWANSLGENIPTMAMMLAPGAGAFNLGKNLGLSGNALKVLATAGSGAGAFTIEAGSTYNDAKQEMLDMGYDEDRADTIATAEGITVGIVNSLLEAAPFHVLIGNPGGKKLLARLVRQGFLEGGTEGVQENVKMLASELGHKPEKSFDDWLNSTIESTIVGTAFGIGMGGFGGVETNISPTKKIQASLNDSINSGEWGVEHLAALDKQFEGTEFEPVIKEAYERLKSQKVQESIKDKIIREEPSKEEIEAQRIIDQSKIKAEEQPKEIKQESENARRIPINEEQVLPRMERETSKQDLIGRGKEEIERKGGEDLYSKEQKQIGGGEKVEKGLEKEPWITGEKRPFKYDPNSTKNEGRFRLQSPELFEKDSYFRRKSTTDGVSYVMGKKSDTGNIEIQAVRFNKNKISERESSKWWDKNKNRLSEKFIEQEKNPSKQIEIKETEATKPKTSGVAKQIEAKAVEQGLIELGYNELAEYQASTMKEQSKLMSKYSFDDAVKMVSGEMELGKGLKPGTPLSVVEKWVNDPKNDANKRAEVSKILMKSNLDTRLSESASDISLSRMREKDSPNRVMKEVVKAREKFVEKKKGKKIEKLEKEEVEKIKKEIKKVKPKQDAWLEFVDSIEC